MIVPFTCSVLKRTGKAMRTAFRRASLFNTPNRMSKGDGLFEADRLGGTQMAQRFRIFGPFWRIAGKLTEVYLRAELFSTPKPGGVSLAHDFPVNVFAGGGGSLGASFAREGGRLAPLPDRLRAPLNLGLPRRVLKYCVGRLLADHKDGREDEVTGNLREDGRVHDAQTPDAVHAEAAVEHGAPVVQLIRVGAPAVRADAAGAAGVVPPCLGLDPVLHLRRVVGYLRAGLNLVDELRGVACVDVAHEADGVNERREVFLPAVARSLLEGVEANLRHVERVGRPQPHGAAVVVCVS